MLPWTSFDGFNLNLQKGYAPTRLPSLRSENSFRKATARSCPSLCRCITAYATASMPADSSTNCRRFSTTSNEPWRSGLISERRIRSSSYAASFQGAACTVGDLGQLPFFGRSAASKGLGQTRGPCDRFPVCRVSVGGEPLACGFPSSFVMPMRSQTVKRGKAPDRPLRGGCRVVRRRAHS